MDTTWETDYGHIATPSEIRELFGNRYYYTVFIKFMTRDYNYVEIINDTLYITTSKGWRDINYFMEGCQIKNLYVDSHPNGEDLIIYEQAEIIHCKYKYAGSIDKKHRHKIELQNLANLCIGFIEGINCMYTYDSNLKDPQNIDFSKIQKLEICGIEPNVFIPLIGNCEFDELSILYCPFDNMEQYLALKAHKLHLMLIEHWVRYCITKNLETFLTKSPVKYLSITAGMDVIQPFSENIRFPNIIGYKFMVPYIKNIPALDEQCKLNSISKTKAARSR
jgi:hypothetical protein